MHMAEISTHGQQDDFRRETMALEGATAEIGYLVNRKTQKIDKLKT